MSVRSSLLCGPGSEKVPSDATAAGCLPVAGGVPTSQQNQIGFGGGLPQLVATAAEGDPGGWRRQLRGVVQAGSTDQLAGVVELLGRLSPMSSFKY